jgi:hypothetical protein
MAESNGSLLCSGELDNGHFDPLLIVQEIVMLDFLDKICFCKQSLRKNFSGQQYNLVYNFAQKFKL